MPDLDFTIRTRAELAGAEAASSLLDQQIGKAKALGKDYTELARQRDKVNESIKNAQVPNAAEIADTQKLELSKRELLESIRGLTREYPVLGEVARAVFNPITAAAFGLIGAYEIHNRQLETMVKLLGGVELPDLSSGVSTAEDMVTAWDGITTAVKNADDAFGGVEQTNARAVKSIEAELKATQAQIEATKNLALAKLNVARAAGMDQGEYDRKKEIIERGASDATAQAEIKARNAQLAAKRKERDDAAAQEAKEREAAQNHLPQNQPEVEKNLADLGKQIEALTKQAEESHATAQKIDQQQIAMQDFETSSGTLGEQLKGLGAALAYDVEVGARIDPETAKGMALQAARDAEQKIDQLKAQVAELKKKVDERNKHQAAAAAAAGKRETLDKELALEDSPDAATTPGTVAYENAQQAARQKDKAAASKINTDATAFASDQKTIGEDYKWFQENAPTPQNQGEFRAKLKQMFDAMSDANDAVAEIASLGGDTRKLGLALVNLQQEVAEVRTIAQRAFDWASNH